VHSKGVFGPKSAKSPGLAAPGQAVLQPGGGAVHLVILAFVVAVLIVTRGRLAAPARSS